MNPYIYIILATFISAAAPEDVCEACVPTQDCPIFENLSYKDQLIWMEEFPCRSHPKNSNYEVLAGFASAAKGDYVCCSNNIWGVEKPEHIGLQIDHRSRNKNQHNKPKDVYNYDNKKTPSNKPDNFNIHDFNKNNETNMPVDYNINNYYYDNNNHNLDNYNSNKNKADKEKFTTNSGNTIWIPDNGQSYSNNNHKYYNNKFPINNNHNFNSNNHINTPNDYNIYYYDNNNPTHHNLDNYDSHANKVNHAMNNNSTVWFPNRTQNYDDTDYWLTHDPGNNRSNIQTRYWNDRPDQKWNIKNTQGPGETNSTKNFTMPDTYYYYYAPGNTARSIFRKNTRRDEEILPVTNYPVENIAGLTPPVNIARQPNQYNPPEAITSPPILQEPPKDIQYNPPENEIRSPNQYDTLENIVRPPNENDASSKIAAPPIHNDPPANIVRPPIQYDSSGNMAKPPSQNSPPAASSQLPNQNEPPKNIAGHPIHYDPPENEIRPPNQYDPLPNQHDPPGNVIKLPNQYDPPRNLIKLPNQYDPPGNVIKLPNQYDPPENVIKLPNQYDLPGNVIQLPNQYDPPRNIVRPPLQYDHPRNIVRPPLGYELSENIARPPYRQPFQYDSPDYVDLPPNQRYPPRSTANPPYNMPPRNNFVPRQTYMNNFPRRPYDERMRRNDFNNPYYNHPSYHSGEGNFEGVGGQCAQLTSFPPDPQSDCCGRQSTDDDRITAKPPVYNRPAYTNQWEQPPSRSGSTWRNRRAIFENNTDDDDVTVERRISGGQATELYQYPWTVLLLTTFDYGNREAAFNCGGSLISAKYVLSAGHCVYDKDAVVKSVQVNLAEYDKRTFPNDCKSTRNGRKCIENIVMYAEEIITHPQYENENLVNDISLIRIRGSAPYTEYIRPICLPSINIDEPQFSNLQFEVAGWGRNGEFSSNVKQSTFLHLVNHDECRRYYPQLTDKHLCAAGQRGADTCKGDSGGPLMILYRGRYYVAGIVSGKRADSPCGTAVPSLYTNVYHYVDWIRRNIKN